MKGLLIRLGIAILAVSCCAATGNSQDISAPTTGKMYVKITRGRELAGQPIQLTSLSVTTGFGKIAIPIEKIDGIKLHVGSDDSAVIAFKNGDLVTGKVALDKISLKTTWGQAHINLEQIETIAATRTARFFPETSGGSKGWRFSNGLTANQP